MNYPQWSCGTYYTAGSSRRYSFYETRKDLARPGNPPATRCQQGTFDRQVSTCVRDLLTDQHALRHLANVTDAGLLRTIFQAAHGLAERLNQPSEVAPTLRSLIRGILIRRDLLEVTLDPATLGAADQPSWVIRVPRPSRRPHGEARIRIDAASPNPAASPQLVKLMAEAFEVQVLVVASLNMICSAATRSLNALRSSPASRPF